MAVTPKAIRVTSAAELETAVNAYLAPFTGASSVRVLGINISSRSNVPFFGKNLFADITTDTVGAAAMASPYQFITFSAPTEAQVEALCSAFVAANPTFFFSQILTVYRPEEPDPVKGVILGLFYTSDANGAANWASYTQAGTAAVYTGNSLWVDAVFGNNATALPNRFDKPYQTIEAGIAAAVAGDTVFVRPGAYTPATGLFKNGVRLHCDLGVAISYDISLFSTGTANTTFRLTGRASFTATGTNARFISHTGGAAGQNAYYEFLEHLTSAVNGNIAINIDVSGPRIDIRCERDFVYNATGSDAIVRIGNSFSSGTLTVHVGGNFQNTGTSFVVGIRQNASVYIRAHQFLASGNAAIGVIAGGSGNWVIEADDLIQGTSAAIALTSGVQATVRAVRIVASAGPAISVTSTAVLNVLGVRTISGTTNCVSMSSGTVQVNGCDTMTASAGTALSVTGGTLNLTGVRTITGTTGVLNLSTGTVTTAGGENWTASGGAAITVSGGTLNLWNAGIISGTTAGITTSGGTITALAVTVTASSGSGVAITGGSGTLTLTATTIQATGGNNAGVNQSGGTGTYIVSQARIIGVGTVAAARRDVATGNLVFANCVFLAPAGAANGISATGATNIIFNTPCTANKALAGTITALVTTPTVSASAI